MAERGPSAGGIRLVSALILGALLCPRGGAQVRPESARVSVNLDEVARRQSSRVPEVAPVFRRELRCL